MSGLSLNGISHAFGTNRVLKDVSVAVAPGELVCLLGPSGCGKTTLLRLAAGLEFLQEGRVDIGGQTVADSAAGVRLAPEKRGVGLMFQDFALFPHLTVSENIAFGIDKRKNGAAQAWITNALSKMGLESYADAYPHTLSGGQQQRVALLRALAPGPGVLLLDEPFSGLDVSRRAAIRAETLHIVKDAGVAALMVTHDPEEAMFMADRILVMNEGHIVQDGTPTDLYFHPENAFVAELFGPVNRFSGKTRGEKVETPIGVVPAPGIPDGTEVDILIRPEGVRVSDASALGDPSSLPRVVTARPLGRSSFLVLELADGTRIEARVHGVFLPAAGTPLSVAVHAPEAFAFTR